MVRSLSVGEKIVLFSRHTETEFVIDEVLGLGGSCIAYKVSYWETEEIPHKGILKEYCPAFLESDDFSRDGTTIRIPQELRASFDEGLTEFKHTYRVINEYLSDNLTAANYHTVQLGLYEGNHTAYTLTSCDYGFSYDKIDDDSLLSICKIMLSVTKAVELYHNAGFLHLDIKPKNILILNDVTELVKLFDFDSLTPIEKVKTREVAGIPAPEDYYVPELESYDLRNVGIATDIFEIGAMLFLRVFQRAPEAEDMSYDAVYRMDDSDLFAGVSPQAKNEFAALLKKTLQISTRKRYKTTNELIAQLEKIISLLSDEKPYLLDLPKWQPSKYCLGRDDELKEIHRRLERDGYVFVKAVGGLGKSELAKLYAARYGDAYHTVQFCKFADNLKTTVALMPVSGINNQDYSNFDDLVNAKNKVLHMSDSKTLIIVDNFNVTYDDFLRDFLPTGNKSFHVIFTTRCTMAAGYYDDKTYLLPRLSVEACKKLFCAHCPDASAKNEDALLEEIIQFVDSNTLILVLMAAAVQKSGISLQEMREKLEAQQMSTISAELFHEYDFSSDEVQAYNQINSHLMTIFSVSRLTELQKEIVKNATLISLNGIGLDEFVENCQSDAIDADAVNSVIELGWLDQDDNAVLSMHPIVSDLFSENEELEKHESYYQLADYLEAFCNPEVCHFSVVMSKLACAKQLQRRYRSEPPHRRAIAASKLGRMYHDVYQPNNARKYLNMALELAKEIEVDNSFKRALITYIYSFLGRVEKDFGTRKKAIAYYQQCIDEGKKIENRFYDIVAESMAAIAECYHANSDNLQAYNAYLEALNYAKLFRLNDHITDIADALVEVCADLDWTDKEALYQKVADRYRIENGDEEEEEYEGAREMSEALVDYDMDAVLAGYEKFLAELREDLGEDSPTYKDIKKNIWASYAATRQKEPMMRLLNENLNFIAETSGRNSIEMADQLSLAAQMLIEFLEFDEVEKFANQAIQICEALNDTHIYAYFRAVFVLASVSLMQGRLQEAKEYVDKIDFFAYSGNDFLEDLVGSAGLILCMLGQYEKAEPLCLKLLERKNASGFGMFRANIILSIINEQRGHLEKAEAYARQANQYIDMIKLTHMKVEWLNQYYRALARIQHHKGNSRDAIRILDEFLDSYAVGEDESYVLSYVYLERGVYYTDDKQLDKAEEDYTRCEQLMRGLHLPEASFVTLYNNFSHLYQVKSDYKKAKEYLDKVAALNPQVLEPESYMDAVICSNIGWVAANLGDTEPAYHHLRKSVAAFERLKASASQNYFISRNCLGVVCIGLEKYEEAYEQYRIIRDIYDCSIDPRGEMALASNSGMILSLIHLGRELEAYDFACDDIANFERWFGRASSVQVAAVIQMGGLFRDNGYPDCCDFFQLANVLIYESKDFHSLNYARLLNYLGVCKTDYDQQHCKAKALFQESKALFEEIGATDDDTYPIVLSNLEYIEDLCMDEIIRELAADLKNDDTQED